MAGRIAENKSDYRQNFDVRLMKLDSGGKVQFKTTIKDTYYGEADSLTQTSDGGYTIAGSVVCGDEKRHLWIVKTDSKGNQQWQKVIKWDEYAFSTLQTTDGSFIIAGEKDSACGDGFNFWDKEYENYLRIWGDNPSELAIIAVKYLKSHQLEDKYLSVLDIGCGYGRDSLYLAKHLNCCVFGIDTSQKAIEILKNSTVDPYTKAIQFKCYNFMDIDQCKYEIVFVSNLYQI